MFPDTVAGFIKKSVSEHGPSLLIQRRDGRSWKQITWKDFEGDVKSIAAFVADAGFEAGDRAFFESCGTYHGLVAETAVLMLGGVAASRLEDGEVPRSKLAFAEDGEKVSRVVRMTGAEKALFFSDGSGSEPRGEAADFRAALKFGFLKSRKTADSLEEKFSSVRPEDPAVEAPAGGGAPETLSQRDFIEMLGSAMRRAGGLLNDRSQTFCRLPRGDLFSRAAKFLPLCARARAAAAESDADFVEDMLEIMPTVVFADSRRLEKAAALLSGGGGGADGSAFGGRLRSIFTDSVPSGETAEFYSKLGIGVSEIFSRG